MSDRLAGKTAVVTAAGQGIGRAIATAFRDAGAKVYATDLDAGKLDGFIGVEARACDVTSWDSVRAWHKKSARQTSSAMWRASSITAIF